MTAVPEMTAAPKPPATYSEWASLITALEDGSQDRSVVDALRRGTLENQTGVTERVVRRLSNLVSARTDQLSQRMQRRIGQIASSGAVERELVSQLLSARREFCYLIGVVDLPALPDDIRPQLRQLVTSAADAMQRALEESATRMPSRGLSFSSDHGMLAKIIRENPVNASLEWTEA